MIQVRMTNYNCVQESIEFRTIKARNPQKACSNQDWYRNQAIRCFHEFHKKHERPTFAHHLKQLAYISDIEILGRKYVLQQYANTFTLFAFWM